MDPTLGDFWTHLSNNRVVLWLTPLFSVDYTRSIARELVAHLSFDRSGGNGQPGPADAGRNKCRKDMRGRLGHSEPLESVGRVNLQKRIDQWTGQGIARVVCKLAATLLRIATPVSTAGRVPMGAGSTFKLNAPIKSGRGPRQNGARALRAVAKALWRVGDLEPAGI